MAQMQPQSIRHISCFGRVTHYRMGGPFRRGVAVPLACSSSWSAVPDVRRRRLSGPSALLADSSRQTANGYCLTVSWFCLFLSRQWVEDERVGGFIVPPEVGGLPNDRMGGCCRGFGKVY